MKSCVRFAAGLMAVLGMAVAAQAQTAASVQSPRRPLGLPLWNTTSGRVMVKGSDTASTAFMSSNFNAFMNIVEDNLGESAAYSQASNNTLAPEKLFFFFDYAPRIYFLMEGAGYTNALGANICDAETSNSSTPDTTRRFVVFPNSQSNKGQWGGDGSSNRTIDYPLQPGDFVQLPMITRGKQLELFLMANQNTLSVPESTYYNQKQQNADGKLHMVAFFPPNSNFVILGFEDIYGGGDLDYNDLVLALDVGGNNAAVWRNPQGSLPK